MTTFQTSKGNFLAVSVPEDASGFDIDGEHLYFKSDVWSLAAIGHLKKLPPGNYQFLFTTKDVGEDDWGKVVEYKETLPFTNFENKIGTKVYNNYCFPLFIPPNFQTIVDYKAQFYTATESGQSSLLDAAEKSIKEINRLKGLIHEVWNKQYPYPEAVQDVWQQFKTKNYL